MLEKRYSPREEREGEGENEIESGKRRKIKGGERGREGEQETRVKEGKT